MNNKGFAITSFLYGILIAFLLIFSILLVNIINTRLSLNSIKINVKEELEGSTNSQGELYAKLVVETQKKTIVVNEDIDLLDGVYLERYDGEVLETSISYTSSPEFDNTTIGTYVINYSAVVNGIEYINHKIVEVTEKVEWTFDFTGEEQTITIPKTGYYSLKTWGAQGGSYSETIVGGYGAYASGTVYLEKGEILYINVGGQGTMNTTKEATVVNGGYNGGGNGYGHTDKYVGSGGGATHIATKSGLLSTLSSQISSILVVAGGGGGAAYQSTSYYGSGGSGGEFFGLPGRGHTTSGLGGTQTSAGTGQSTGSFGQGGSSTSNGTGGGGGFYGGGGGQYYGSGGGGSSFVGNSSLVDRKMYAYSKANSYLNVSEIAQSDYAKKGNGYAKISYLSTVNLSEFEYPGEYIYTAPKSGYYKLEVWGAQGGSYSETIIGGYGAYSTGKVYLTAGSNLYVNVGGEGKIAESRYEYLIPGGYNGGGNGYGYTDKYVGSGGGATHIATKSGLLSTLSSQTSSILIVAGGGGGATYQDSSHYGSGGGGGGYTGNTGFYNTNVSGATGATQTAAGTGQSTGSFGQGGSSTNNGTGGGGGFYGGGGGQYYKGGGGGSGYIANTLLKSKYMYCYNCNTSENDTILTYSTTNVSETLQSNYAKKGNGYAKITYLGSYNNM